MKHYLKARNDGELKPLAPDPNRHSLTNIDRQNRTADCSICGTAVQVRVREDKSSVECRGSRRARDRERVRTNKPKSKNPPYTPERGRRKRLAEKYGLTPEEYEVMKQRQNGRCAICGTESEELLHVDHCHETGKVRGLLCRPCNCGIGHLREDVDVMLSAIAYLRGHASREDVEHSETETAA